MTNAPRPIARLSEAVVNRIAAGEIIQRPANALKELLENALDAGSTRIVVSCKDGGLKLLQIQDNGHGIRTEDLPILCERFTTSKLRDFEDLSSMQTYGFRGEALASISHVAHLTVTTKTRDDAHAWKVSYHDGKMASTKGSEAPVPCAGNDGTLLSVEDLFYNTPQRLKALRSGSEEYARIVSVVESYAIHNAGVAMSCKKHGTGAADVSTLANATTLDNLGAVYGETVREELLEIVKEDEQLGVKLHAWTSSPNYQGRKSTYLFFINHRLVDSGPIKRALESFYSRILPKGSHPFVYLALEISPAKVDVNVHPTKKEVNFEDEDEVIELICDALAQKLEEHAGSRSFKVQTLLPGARPAAVPPASDSSSMLPPPSKVRKVAPNKLVRTDAMSQTLEAFMPSTNAPSVASGSVGQTSDHSAAYAALQLTQAKETRTKIPQSECALTSVQLMRKDVVDNKHAGLEMIIRNHIFVGIADVDSTIAMIQHQTKLYNVNYAALSEELFYQLALRQFGRFVKINLKQPPSLEKLVRLAVESDPDSETAQLSRDTIVHRICKRLTDSREMLAEYFSFVVSPDGNIQSLPLVLPGYKPNMNRLPLFLVRLGVYVNWLEERPCFESFLRELAYFYAPLPGPYEGAEESDERKKEAESELKRQLEHVVFPAAKQYLQPPERLLQNDVTCITSLESLYRVFERC